MIWLSLLLRAWIFGPYMQQRIAEIILYVRSSVPESFFHRLRINISKAHHTTDFGMDVGGAKSQLDHNELKTDKVLTAAIEITKYHKEKGMRTERAAAPAERVWVEDGAMEVFKDIPVRVNLGDQRLKKAAASKRERVHFCAELEALLARGETPKRRRGGPSRPMPDMVPSAPLRLASKADGTLVNTYERVRADAATVPMHPFSSVCPPRAVGEGRGVNPGSGTHLHTAVQAMMEDGMV